MSDHHLQIKCQIMSVFGVSLLDISKALVELVVCGFLHFMINVTWRENVNNVNKHVVLVCAKQMMYISIYSWIWKRNSEIGGGNSRWNQDEHTQSPWCITCWVNQWIRFAMHFPEQTRESHSRPLPWLCGPQWLKYFKCQLSGVS